MGAILVTCRDQAYTDRHYVSALRLAGWAGEVRILTPDDALPRPPESALDGVSGLLLTGGRDIHPGNWDPDEDLHPTADVDDGRDALEIAVVREAWQRRIPVLGICRGEQVLNVALGGSLIQDIPSHFHCTREAHQCGRSESPEVHHSVQVEPGSLLESLVGPGPLEVNSRHHQAVGRLSPELRSAAFDSRTAKEGQSLVEAVESRREGHWVLGVQWHPENLAGREDAAGEAARRLFSAFIARAGTARGG